MSEVVTYNREGTVGVITVDYPPVNALGHAVRSGLLAALEQGLKDSEAKVLLLVCEGRTFIAGADIREFGKPIQEPSLPEVMNVFENSDKPVVAAIHGTASVVAWKRPWLSLPDCPEQRQGWPAGSEAGPVARCRRNPAPAAPDRCPQGPGNDHHW